MRPIHVAALLAALLLASTDLRAEGPGFKVIVHPGNPMTEVKREELSKIFLRKTTEWGGPQTPSPVDQSAEAVRGAFNAKVHGKSAGALRLYWQQQVFAGRGSPPEEKPGDAAVVEYVARTPNGIGYVSEETSTKGAKVIALKE